MKFTSLFIASPLAIFLLGRPQNNAVDSFSIPTGITGQYTAVPRLLSNVADSFKSDRKFALFSSPADTLAPGIEAIEKMNSDINVLLNELKLEPQFRLYSVDLLGNCEYMPQELFECYTQSCEIYPVDDDEVPETIRSIDSEEHDFELDGWARFDMPCEDYYDTRQFPESFTGYDGSDVWRFIHDRIAFHDDTLLDEYDAENWKADFNKAVSGLHSMVSAQVVRGLEKKIANGEELEEDCEWTDPKVEFDRRLGPNGETPKAMENLYFSYMLVLSAVQRARGRLLQDCEEGKFDQSTVDKLRPVLSHPLLDDPSISVASKKLHDHAVQDEYSVTALWEARMRSRELFRIMNCVQCNKCRFHGKISSLGLSTALQVVLGRSGEGGDITRIHRVELAALLTTLSKFSTAVSYCQKMRS
jgi:hypothetical protein